MRYIKKEGWIHNGRARESRFSCSFLLETCFGNRIYLMKTNMAPWVPLYDSLTARNGVSDNSDVFGVSTRLLRILDLVSSWFVFPLLACISRFKVWILFRQQLDIWRILFKAKAWFKHLWSCLLDYCNVNISLHIYSYASVNLEVTLTCHFALNVDK